MRGLGEAMELGDWLEVVCDFDSRKAVVVGVMDEWWRLRLVKSCGWLDPCIFIFCKWAKELNAKTSVDGSEIPNNHLRC